MTGQDLKNSILQLAIQGKLVEQRPEEGTAKELLEKIKEEKEKLIKEGKIKKSKPLPEITEDEIPFEIPESWEWVRLGDVCLLNDGVKVTNVSLPYLEARYLRGKINPKIKNNGRYTSKGEYVILVDGENSGEVFITEEAGIIGSTFKLLMINNAMYNKYILNLLRFYQRVFRKRKRGAAIPHLDKTLFKTLVIGVPPLEEQKRIVAKIEELMPYVEKYDKAYSKLEELNKKFPEDIQKSILQYAVQGKLEEQRPEEGTAEELYKQIQQEKQKLIKEGKIKKSKPLPEITEDEIPFEIPESWKWVRLEQICEYIQRGKSPKYSDVKKYPVVAQKCNQWSGFSLEKAKFIDPKTLNSYTVERILQDGDLMWNSTGLGTLGRVAIYKKNKNPYELAVADSHVTVIRPLKKYVDFKYLYYYIANPSVQSVIEKQSSGSTKQIELTTNTVKNYIVPLPPLEEQKRIVAKIEELLPYTKQLAKQ